MSNAVSRIKITLQAGEPWWAFNSALDPLILETESDSVRVSSIALLNPSSCIREPQKVDGGLPLSTFSLFPAVPTELV